jgi:hypothetical protein
MSWDKKKLGVLLVASAAVGVPIAPSFAQGMRLGAMTTYIEPRDVGGRHCPGLSWHFDRVEQPDKTAHFSGPVWYEDGSGISFAQGTGQPDGHFTLNVKTASGDGPTGTVTGQRMPDGSVDATAVGPQCFAGKIFLKPGQTSTRM